MLGLISNLTQSAENQQVKSPRVQAAIWCGVTFFIGGLLVDIIAILAVFFKSETSPMYYDIVSPEVVGGYVLCITGATLTDLFFLEEKVKARTAIVLSALFLILLIPVALCRAHAPMNDTRILIMFSIVLPGATLIAWLVKSHMFTIEQLKSQKNTSNPD